MGWLESSGFVLNKAGKLVRPLANRMQRDIGMIYRYCRDNSIPCRLVALKPRQTGMSTASMTLMYHHCQNYRTNALVIGDEFEKSVANLVRMFERFADTDEFDWGNEYNPKQNKFSHGSQLFTETANDPRAGAANTFQFCCATEVAHWPDGRGERSAARTMAAVLNCVPELPDTVVILESTPNGASGVFYETYQGAVTFEEFKAGKRGNGYIKIFYPWFEHDEYCVDLTPEDKAEIKATMTQVERDFAAKYKLQLGHVAFRRRTLASPKFNGDEKLFDQEYCPDDVSCFLTSGRKKFNQEALQRMMQKAKAEATRVHYGVLDGEYNAMTFRRASKEESWVWLWEFPKHGCRYIVCADPATGIANTGGKDPDAHSVLVLRCSYVDQYARLIAPKVVARVFAPCHVDIDVLCEYVTKLCIYFGNCMFVPEANNSGIAVIELLKKDGIVDIYRREQWNYRESKVTEFLGWQTKDGAGREGTRSMCIGNLAALIREEGIDIPCEHIIAQCQKFIVDDTGKAQAPPGEHDDDVLSLAIGVTTWEAATTYKDDVRMRALPADLRPYAPGRNQGRGRYS